MSNAVECSTGLGTRLFGAAGLGFQAVMGMLVAVAAYVTIIVSAVFQLALTAKLSVLRRIITPTVSGTRSTTTWILSLSGWKGRDTFTRRA